MVRFVIAWIATLALCITPSKAQPASSLVIEVELAARQVATVKLAGWH